jgi:hypothetical protein
VNGLTTMSAGVSAVSVFLLWGLADSLELLCMFAITYGFFAAGYTAMWARMGSEVVVAKSRASGEDQQVGEGDELGVRNGREAGVRDGMDGDEENPASTQNQSQSQHQTAAPTPSTNMPDNTRESSRTLAEQERDRQNQASFNAFSTFNAGKGLGNILAGPISAALLQHSSPSTDADSPGGNFGGHGYGYANGRFEKVVLFAGSCMLMSAVVIVIGVGNGSGWGRMGKGWRWGMGRVRRLVRGLTA